MRALALVAVLLLPSVAAAEYCHYDMDNPSEFERCSERERERRIQQQYDDLDRDRAHRAQLDQQRQLDEMRAEMDSLRAGR